MVQKIFLFTFLVSSPWLVAAEFPGHLTESDVESVNLKLAGAMEERPWTLADNRPREGVDITLGLESSLSFDTNVNSYGDESGNVPGVMPVPKIDASIAFPEDIHVSASVLPDMAGIFTYGLAGEWFFWRDRQLLSYSVLLHYSHTELFNEYSANTQGAQVTASHPFKDFSLYGALGIISVESRVSQELLNPGTTDQYFGMWQPHIVMGGKINGDFPVSLQAELIRFEPSFALMVAKEF